MPKRHRHEYAGPIGWRPIKSPDNSGTWTKQQFGWERIWKKDCSCGKTMYYIEKASTLMKALARGPHAYAEKP